MTVRHFTVALLATSILTAPVAPAFARGGDAIVGGIIGGIIGGAIANESKKKKVVTRAPATKKPTVSTAQREDNRQVQAALNYFGFPAGTPDGVFGARTRGAIEEFQMALGYPPTGQLSEFEHDFLLTSHQRAELGGANTLALIAQNPMGARGLLVGYRDELAGGSAGGGQVMSAGAIAPPQAPGLDMVPGAGPISANVPAVAPPVAAPAAPRIVAGQSAAPSLPSFGAPAAGVQMASLASHCNQVSLVTGTNGGYATLVSMTDPDQALDEQFCLARTYAISTGEELAAQLQGVTPAQLTEQCGAFGPVMAAAVAGLPSKDPAAVLTDARAVAQGTGMAPAQLSGTAKVCLSVGYRTDDMGVALGSALLLAALGEGAYGELLGHHLMRGFGVTQAPQQAKAWFQVGLDALSAGQPPVFAPGQPERADLIRAVVFGQRPLPAPVPAGAEGVRNKIPGFSINQ